MQPIQIELIPVGQPVGPLKWNMSMNFAPPQGPGQYPVITVPPAQTPDLIFTIRHPGAIQFAKTDAFCAQAGTAKPTTKCDSTAFSSSINKDGALVVHDVNPTQGTYTYVINFEPGPPQLDPIIKNGGCCTGTTTSFSSIQYVEIAAAVILVAAVVVFAWRQFATARQDRPKDR